MIMKLEVTLGDTEVNAAIAGIVREKTGNTNIEVTGWKATKGKTLVATCETIETKRES
jgi:hypothetical protein